MSGCFIDILVLLRSSVLVADVQVLQALLLYRFRARGYLIQHGVSSLILPLDGQHTLNWGLTHH